MLTVKKNIFPIIIFAFFVLFLAHIYFISNEMFLVIAAWWMVTIILLPALLSSVLVKSLGLRFFVAVCFFTQFLTVPWFVSRKDRYTYSGWTAVKDFDFRLTEFAEIYLPIGVFLFLLVVVFLIISKLMPLPSVQKKRYRCFPNRRDSFFSNSKAISNPRQKKYTLLILIIVLLLIPLNLWMFQNGISMTGIKPPMLPFKMSGILHYSTTFLVPALLFYLYTKSARNALPASILLFYALILGTSHISRSATIFMLFPVIFYALIDKKKQFLLILSSVWGLIAIQVSSLMRNVVYFYGGAGSRNSAATDAGFSTRMYDFFSTQAVNIDLVDMAFSIVSRIESPQSIVLGSQFDPDAIGGKIVMLKRLFYQGWIQIDSDAFHLEWIGKTLPKGFAAAGGFLSAVLSISGNNMFFLIFLSFITAMYIYFGEYLVRKINHRFNFLGLYSALILLYVVCFVTSVGTIMWWGMIAFMVFLLLMPKMKIVCNPVPNKLCS